MFNTAFTVEAIFNDVRKKNCRRIHGIDKEQKRQDQPIELDVMPLNPETQELRRN